MVTGLYSYCMDQYPVLDPKFYNTNGTSVSFSRQTFVVHKTLYFRRRRDERFRAGVTVARFDANIKMSRTRVHYTPILYKLKCGEIGLKIMSRKNSRKNAHNELDYHIFFFMVFSRNSL